MLRTALLRFTTEIQLAHPMTKGSGLMAYLGVGILELVGLWVPEGGGTSFTNAVIKSIEAHGGEIRLNTTVDKILVEDGRAVGIETQDGPIYANDAVIGMIHPHLLDKFVPGLDPTLLKDAKDTKMSEFTLFAIHAALNEPLRFKAGPMADRTVMNTICPGRIEDLIRSYDEMAEGKLPTNVMIGGSPVSSADPTRAPPGKATLHAVVMCSPVPAEGGWENWDNIKERWADDVFAYLRKYVHNLGPDNIRAYEIVTPADHEKDSPSFQHGDISGLSMSGTQMGASRPTPALQNSPLPPTCTSLPSSSTIMASRFGLSSPTVVSSAIASGFNPQAEDVTSVIPQPCLQFIFSGGHSSSKAFFCLSA